MLIALLNEVALSSGDAGKFRLWFPWLEVPENVAQPGKGAPLEGSLPATPADEDVGLLSFQGTSSFIWGWVVLERGRQSQPLVLKQSPG